MRRSSCCSEEQRTLIKKVTREGKTYEEVQTIIGCSPKMIPNALKWQQKPKRSEENIKLPFERIEE